MANVVQIILQASDKASAELNKATKSMGGLSAAGMALSAVAVTAGYEMVKFLKSSVVEAEIAAKVQAQLATVIESTGGAAGMTADQINDMANTLSDLTGVEDDLIIKNSALMLTFTKVSKEVFPATMQAALDMSAVIGQDLQSSVTQLGKALNDPILGITALSRVGVAFTAEQKAMIKTMVEAGDVMGAQKVILAELNTEFGGAAKAQHEAGTGSDDLANAISNLKETIGGGLNPVLANANKLLAAYIDLLNNSISLEADLLAAAEKGIITQTQANNMITIGTWTAKGRASTQEWLNKKTEEYNKLYARSIPLIDSYAIKVGAAVSAEEDEVIAKENLVIAEAMRNTELEKSIGYQNSANELAARSLPVYAALQSALEKANIPLAEKNRLLREGAILAGTTTAKEQEMLRQVNILTLAYEAGAISEDEYTEARDNLANGIPYAVTQAGNLELGMQNLAIDTYEAADAANALKQRIAELKDKVVTITVKYNAVGGLIYTGVDKGERQFGGPVTANVPYLVGEAGPELFVPSTSGKIVSNKNMASGGVSIGEINVYASDSMDEQSLAQLVIARLAAATRNSGYAGLDYAG